MSASPGRTQSNETQHAFVKHAWKEYESVVKHVAVTISGKSNNVAKFNWNADSYGSTRARRGWEKQLSVCAILKQFS